MESFNELPRPHFLKLGGAAAAMPALPRLACALDYPTHSVRIVVGFPPGGPTDIYARLIGQWLSDRLGQPFVVENRPAPAVRSEWSPSSRRRPTAIRCFWSARRPPSTASYYKNLSFELIRDIAPVCGISLEPLVMVVNPSVPAKTVPEFIAYAKANPGKVDMASVGNGTTPHLGGELFMTMAGVNLLHVPYHGAAPALTDLLGGRADVMFEAMTDFGRIPEHRQAAGLGGDDGETLAGVSASCRPIGEFLPGYEASVWFGIGAPKKTPAEIVERLNKEINAGLTDPKLGARLSEGGGTPLTGSTADFEKLFVEDAQKWAKVMREANIKPE